MAARIIGIDVGSVSASMVVVTREGAIEWSGYRFHQGRPAEALQALGTKLLEKHPELAEKAPIAATDETPQFVAADSRADSVVAAVRTCRHAHPDARALLMVGGERFFLVRFAEDGSYRSIRSSSSCAAGTGSFLDQQARRLDLGPDANQATAEGTAELSRRALSSTGDTPQIASRCSVFAKTDLIHAQQEGYSLDQICNGLCQGLARNLINTVTQDAELPQPVVFAGGVSRNKAVRIHIESIIGKELNVDAFGHLYGAIGAALDAFQTSDASTSSDQTFLSRLREDRGSTRSYQYEPLALTRSDYPDFAAHRTEIYRASRVAGTADGNGKAVEVDLYRDGQHPARNDGHAGANPHHDADRPLRVRVGIDVGSTSTKAVLVDDAGEVVAGYYTRTSGAPVHAVQALFDAIDATAAREGWKLEVIGAATTGSGRSFVGAIVGADLVLDEITAHARAATEIDPEVDTIIEIGGQDAKFTTLKNGVVTFSQMNAVCAAGTGSFLEEQAAKLDVSVNAYAEEALDVPAPLASDRCTVFMERDINNYLNRGYSTREILAAALHSVRENYLHKVADTAIIGTRVCFQGATAKNRALVAAFEQKLEQPIAVSLYCHLTGAYGAALVLADEAKTRAETAGRTGETSFRGLDLFGDEVPVETEICPYCGNHCRIRLTTVKGQQVAYGFLCGRDYETKGRVSENVSGFDLLKTRKQIWKEVLREGAHDGSEPAASDATPVLGIPTGIYLASTFRFWETFFDALAIPTVTSERVKGTVKTGRRLAGAEFCAPMMQLHGQVAHLLEKADYVFLPMQLTTSEESSLRRSRSYCYYSQLASSILPEIYEGRRRKQFLSPLVQPGEAKSNIDELFGALAALRPGLTRTEVAGAYERAQTLTREFDRRLKAHFNELTALADAPEVGARQAGAPEGGAAEGGAAEGVAADGDAAAPGANGTARAARGIRAEGASDGEGAPGADNEPGSANRRSRRDFAAVLLGRPYTILSEEMNQRIPEILAKHGVRAFYQDMVPPTRADRDAVDPLLKEIPWSYAAQILEAATTCAQREGLYPVLVTSFKCSPDAFIVDYFKKILDSYEKPYLILQLDDHDSNVGYETRIEAALRAFANHYRDRHEREAKHARLSTRDGTSGATARPEGERPSFNPEFTNSLEGKTVLFPNWDSLTNRLIVAGLRSRGIDARLLREDPLTIQRSMKTNSGQCIPVNVIAEESISYVREEGLDPEQTVLWMPRGKWACNLPLYPHYIKSLFEDAAMPIGVYSGDFTLKDVSLGATYDAYFGYLFGGMLRRLGCMIRPYERTPGETNRVIARSAAYLEEVFTARTSKADAWEEVVGQLMAIDRDTEQQRPQVAIFGDLYVRDNDIANQNLIETIEEAGGEVVTTPYSDYVKVIASAHFRKLLRERNLLQWGTLRAVHAVLTRVERRFYRPLSDLMPEGPDDTSTQDIEAELAQFNMRPEQSGESVENVLKIFHILRHHPKVALFVQASPAFCCPSLITESLGSRIQDLTGVPVVSVTYDGTGTYQNNIVIPYLKLTG